MNTYEMMHADTAKLHYEGKSNLGKKIIIDAANLCGTYEVMTMYPGGREIETERVSTLEEAERVYKRMLNKYTRPLIAPQPKPLAGKYKKLAEDLKIALAVGRAAEDANHEDGGTCNFDDPMISLPRWNEELVKRAAKEAGTNAFTVKLYGGKYFIFGADTRAQANARTRNAEAMYSALKNMGYDATMYYQMD